MQPVSTDPQTPWKGNKKRLVRAACRAFVKTPHPLERLTCFEEMYPRITKKAIALSQRNTDIAVLTRHAYSYAFSSSLPECIRLLREMDDSMDSLLAKILQRKTV